MADRLERAMKTLDEVKDAIDEIRPLRTQRRAKEVEEAREDTQEHRQRLLERQEETEKELERAEKLLERIVDENDDEESDQELRLVETIADLETELEERHERIARLWDRAHEQGERFRRLDQLAKARDARQRKLKGRKQKVKDRIEEIKKARAEAKTGTGAWGGSQSIVEQEVVPVYGHNGVPVTSRKRAATHPLSISNPSSDHNMANTTAYAADGGTVSGAETAQDAAKALGISNYSTGNFNSYSITRAGKSFRVQILWAVEGHFDHVHTGVRLG
jgi:hypothetical protein